MERSLPYNLNDIEAVYCLSFGLLLIIGTLLLAVLNVPLLWLHWRRKPSTERCLFLLLSASDFLTCIPFSLIQGPILIFFWKQGSLGQWYTVQKIRYIPDLLGSFFGCLSLDLASFLAVLRLFKLTRPFTQFNNKLLSCCFVILVMYHILYVIVFLSSLPRPSIDIQSNDALVILLQGSIVLQFVLALIGTTSSLISVFYLLKHKNITSPTTSHNAHLHQKKKRSCNTLLLMNIPYFAVLILALICLKRIEKFDGTFDLMHVIYTVVKLRSQCDVQSTGTPPPQGILLAYNFEDAWTGAASVSWSNITAYSKY